MRVESAEPDRCAKSFFVIGMLLWQSQNNIPQQRTTFQAEIARQWGALPLHQSVAEYSTLPLARQVFKDWFDAYKTIIVALQTTS
jgi:hypothetical protein